MKPLPRNKVMQKEKVTSLPGIKDPGRSPVQKIKKKKPALYLLALFIFYFLVLFSVQFFRYIQLNNDLRALNREIEAIEQENAFLSQEIERLHDPEYLEELARGRLGMVRRGEILFYIQDAPVNP